MAIKVMASRKDAAGQSVWEPTLSYVGAVLALREYNMRDDSDFYAVVWDEPTQSLRQVTNSTTRCDTDGHCAEVDETPEVIAQAEPYVDRCALEQLRQENLDESRRVLKGRPVRVVKGRKVPRGTMGWVGWIEESSFGRPRGSTERLATIDSTPDERGDRTRYYRVSIGNLEVIEPDQFLRSEPELEADAARWATAHCWHVFMKPSGAGL